MERQSIYKDEYLTEEEENSEDEKYINLYSFISTKIKTNIALMNYLWEIGWYEKEDMEYSGDEPLSDDVWSEANRLMDKWELTDLRYQLDDTISQAKKSLGEIK